MFDRILATASMCWVVLALAGCAGTDESVPPAIRLGQDECAECGMPINEDRFSAAVEFLIEGRRKWLFFDDIGDMLDHERDKPHPVIDRFVHDYETRRWHRATGATFVYSDAIHTPMGSGLAAFTDREIAAKRAVAWSGRAMNFDQVVAFRVDYMKARYGGN